jgi:hypothetical protein
MKITRWDRRASAEDRIKARTHRNRHGCLLWLGALQTNGYGQITINKRGRLVHRVAFELAYGPLNPADVVMHLCEQKYPLGDITSRRCCTPTHLKKGAQAQNIRMARPRILR